MKRKLIAFDLDDTLSVTKSPMSGRMAALLGQLLERYEVCIISGGRFEQFHIQVIDCLNVPEHLLEKLHIMPTCGTRYYRYNVVQRSWEQQYADDFSKDDARRIMSVLETSAKELGLWVETPAGDIIEDRGSQITYSALGQNAKAADKYAWAEKNSARRQQLRDMVADLLPEVEVRQGGTTSIDITQKGIDKAYGMEKLMELHGFTKEDILFVGDKLQEGGNDYPVKAMGIDTIEVDGWTDTAFVLEGVLATT